MILDGNNVLYDELKALDDTDSPYTTQGKELYTVDTTNGVLTVTLATADTSAGFHKRLFDVGGNIETNAVTINTEGSENVDGGGSVTWDHNNGSYVDLWSDGANWFTSLQAAFDALAADSVTVGTDTITDFAGPGLGVSSNALTALAGTGITVSGDAINQNIQTVSSSTNTSGSGVYLVDTSSAGVTLTLDSDDASGNETITVINIDGSNPVTVNTEGSETIDPNAEASKSINAAGWAVRFTADGTNWHASKTAEFNSVDASSYAVGGSDLLKSNEFVTLQPHTPREDQTDATTTSTSYTPIFSANGWVDLDNVPAAASVYARLVWRMKISSGSETVFGRVDMWDSSNNQTALTETEVSTSSTANVTLDSGWVEVTSISADGVYRPDFRGKVSSGTGTYRTEWCGILIGWRID